ncbi:hypothetical protein JL722_4024 [Aureococcus anophagefferens]|nr:hypothetical protein JL722_4024 [Aureococcus anophagefferens]
MVSNLQCPITQSLPVRPALAEDGHVYERSAIEKWLQTKSTSPLTGREMGKTLMDSTSTRTLIQSAIENGGVADDAAATWHLESAKLIAAGEMPGAISSVKDHLELADARSSSPEITLSLEAVNLKLQQDAPEAPAPLAPAPLGYKIANPDGANWFFPFDAVSLAAY